MDRDRVGQRDREIHEHASTNTNSRGDRAQRSRWAFFNSLLAVLYLLGTSSFAAANPFDDASAAYERGDYVQGIKLFRQLAAQGHQWAQRRLGLIYAEGKGVPQDYQEAVKWYRCQESKLKNCD
jgi:TPR repeat protein